MEVRLLCAPSRKPSCTPDRPEKFIPPIHRLKLGVGNYSPRLGLFGIVFHFIKQDFGVLLKLLDFRLMLLSLLRLLTHQLLIELLLLE
jgi:hypothetical protein